MSDGEALAAAALALGVGIVEGEAGGEIVLLPVHAAAAPTEATRAVAVEDAAGSLDLLVERPGLADIVDRISEARAAAPRRRQFDSDRPFGRPAHQLGDPRFRRRSQGQRRGAGAGGG